MRRQSIHGLRAGDARHEFHREGIHAPLGERSGLLLVAMRFEQGDDRLTRVEQAQFVVERRAHLEDDLRAVSRRLGIVMNIAARFDKILIPNAEPIPAQVSIVTE